MVLQADASRLSLISLVQVGTAAIAAQAAACRPPLPLPLPLPLPPPEEAWLCRATKAQMDDRNAIAPCKASSQFPLKTLTGG
jgi:hypothetical protein